MITIELEICSDSKKVWYQNGLYHRDNGEPAIIYSDGTKVWYQFGIEKVFLLSGKNDNYSAYSIPRRDKILV
jgi:hypothetical protein